MSESSNSVCKPVCAYCSKSGPLDRDHVVPRSRGGPDNATNIVLACKSCNSSKGDRTPSEWLGERCPEKIKSIEQKVNDKLASTFKKRDRKGTQKRQEKLYACHVRENADEHYQGYSGVVVDYVGEVLHEQSGTIRIEAIDAMLFVFGVWLPCGELYDFPVSECRLFNDRDACAQFAQDSCRDLDEHRALHRGIA